MEKSNNFALFLLLLSDKRLCSLWLGQCVAAVWVLCFLLKLNQQEPNGSPDELADADDESNENAIARGHRQSFYRHEEAALASADLQGNVPASSVSDAAKVWQL